MAERDPVKYLVYSIPIPGASSMMLRARIIMLLFVVLFACLASPALSRQQPPESESAVAVTSTTPVDESKLDMVFCLIAACKYGGHWQDCYCCGNVYQTSSCRRTLEECKAHCPLCNPKCSPPPPPVAAVRSAVVDGTALAAADDATT